MKISRRIILGLLPLLSACNIIPVTPGGPGTVSTGIQILESIISLAGAALAIIGPTAGLSPVLISQIQGYVAAVSQAILAVISALRSGAVLTKASAVIQSLEALASSPALLGKVPAQVVNILTAIATAVSSFINSQPQAGTAAHAFAAAGPSKADLAALSALEANAKAVLAKAGK